jgi:hypothetical protein
MVWAEDTEALVWSFVLDYPKDAERLPIGLERYIEEERQAMSGDPEREARLLLKQVAEVEQERRGFLRLAARGSITDREFDEALAELEKTRKVAGRELDTLHARTERLANLELEAEALLEHYTEMTREGLEAYTPENRHDAYRALRLRITVNPDGGMEADRVFMLEPELCNSELASASTKPGAATLDTRP